MNKSDPIDIQDINNNTEIDGDFSLLPVSSLNLDKNSIKETNFSHKTNIKWLQSVRGMNKWTNAYYIINYVLQEIERIIPEQEELWKITINDAIDKIIEANYDKNKIASQLKNWIDADKMKKLEDLATTDPLTKVWNRRFIKKALNDKIADFHRNWERTSILLVDIDLRYPLLP